jgi:hypothetical protein
MIKKIKWAMLVVVLAAICTGAVSVLLTPPASAASGCWVVDCNICCRGRGGVICTQRACI